MSMFCDEYAINRMYYLRNIFDNWPPPSFASLFNNKNYIHYTHVTCFISRVLLNKNFNRFVIKNSKKILSF